MRVFLVGLLTVIVLAACVSSASHAIAAEGKTCEPGTADHGGKSPSLEPVSLPVSWQLWIDLEDLPYLLPIWNSPVQASIEYFSTLPTRSPPIG
ncbi:MAG TPA: hypothetical protein VJO34_01080 [Methylomirabilota bacterium]|nr:hypothetical protein [Methylomirabilota bacterium]